MPSHTPRTVVALVTSVLLLSTLHSGARAQGPAPAPTPGTPATPAVRPAKADVVRAAYEKARRLFRQSKYKDAIRAFDEVKDLRYHPILDYGIAKCHEALNDFKSAIYYLRKYVRNYPRHPMSKRHPTVADAKVKIGVLNKRLTQKKSVLPPVPRDGPGPVRAVTPPPEPGALPHRRVAGVTQPSTTPRGHTGEAFPGPYPFGRIYAVSKPKVWTRKSVILFFGLGGGAFVREEEGTLGEKLSANGGLDLGVLWRINPYVAVGPTAYISGGVTRDSFEAVDLGATTDGASTLHASILLETRGILPVSRVDLWLGFAIGYTHVSTDYEIGTSEREVTIPSVGMRATIGMDIFLTETFTLGLAFAFIGAVPTKVCVQDQACSKPRDRHYSGLLWHLGMNFTWHLPTSTLPKNKR